MREFHPILLIFLKFRQQEKRPAPPCAGPLPALLDTRAVAFMTLGQTEAALKDLEFVTAESPSPNRSFRLARAYHLANRRDRAITTFSDAKKDGLRPETIDPLEQATYRELSAALAN